MSRMLHRVFLFVVVVFVVVALFSVEAMAEKRIGILLWTKENHYTESLNGIIEQLKKEGFGEPKVKFIVENAEGNKAKAAEITHKFATARLDMVISLGTPATVAIAKEIKDIPVVFSTVYDPVEAKIVEDWKSSGNNITGASNKSSMSELISTLKQLTPVKTLAVLYTPHEKNSEIQLKELQDTQNDYQVRIVPVPLSNKDDVALLLPNVVGTVAAIYLSGSSVAGSEISTILDIATKAKVITVTHLPERVEKGVLLGVCANSYAVGLLAGEKAAKVLRGTKPSSIPIGTLKKLDVILNMKTAKTGYFDIPPSFLKSATKVIE